RLVRPGEGSRDGPAVAAERRAPLGVTGDPSGRGDLARVQRIERVRGAGALLCFPHRFRSMAPRSPSRAVTRGRAIVVNGRRRAAILVAAALGLASFAASCGGSSGGGSSSGGSSDAIRGQTMTELIAYKMPRQLRDQFTDE